MDSTLRAFLQARRGGLRQRELAGAAGLNLTRYERLERGVLDTVRLDALLRVSDVLRLDRNDRLDFLRLARPDLSFVLVEGQASRTGHWRSLHKVASLLRAAKGLREPVRLAVEIVHASFGPDLSVSALKRSGDRNFEVDFCIGVRGDAANCPRDAFTTPMAPACGEVHKQAQGGLTLAYAPMCARGKVFAALGIGYEQNAFADHECFAFLRTVADLLEVRLKQPAYVHGH
jgi:transcriptional regulator with XRE-family HTH domain